MFDEDIPSTIHIPVVTTDDISSFESGAEVTLGVEETSITDNKNNVEQVWGVCVCVCVCVTGCCYCSTGYDLQG